MTKQSLAKLSVGGKCGCIQRKKNHGGKGTAEYRSWDGMKVRCFNKAGKDYMRYGGRGITVCDRWKNSFPDFLSDMGTKPTQKHSIDRIDNNGNYEKSNCRWATPKQQAANTSRSNPPVKKICVACEKPYMIDARKKDGSKYCSWKCRCPNAC